MITTKLCVLISSFFVAEIIAQCANSEDEFIGDKCYQFNAENVTWSYAQKQCNDQGYTMASIHNLNESIAIGEAATRRFAKENVILHWIGLTLASTGDYWDDSTPVDYYKWVDGFPTVYPHVAVDLPDSYKWFTTPDSSILSSICTYYPTSPKPTAPPKSGCQPSDIILGNRCYSFNRDELSHTDALIQCGKIGKTLAILDSISQNTFLSSYASTQFGTNYASFWIGLQRNTPSTPFYWQDGGSIQFTNWSPGYPFDGQRFVGQDISNTKWKTFSDNELLFSVCSGTV